MVYFDVHHIHQNACLEWHLIGFHDILSGLLAITPSIVMSVNAEFAPFLKPTTLRT